MTPEADRSTKCKHVIGQNHVKTDLSERELVINSGVRTKNPTGSKSS